MESGPDHDNPGCPVNRIVLFTDEPLYANGIRALLAAETGIELAGCCDNPGLLPDMVKDVRPNAVVLDLNPELNLAVLKDIHDVLPDCRILVLARSLPAALFYQLRLSGVAAILRRDCRLDEFVTHLADASRYRAGTLGHQAEHLELPSGVRLSRRERQLVSLLTLGLRNKEIAERLAISEGTVKVYLSKLFQKVGVSDRFEMAMLALRGLIANGAGAHILLESVAIRDYRRSRVAETAELARQSMETGRNVAVRSL